MITIAILCYASLLFSLSIVRVKTQLCYGMSQYEECSSNSGCGCFTLAGTTGVGICAPQWSTCSSLVTCSAINKRCFEPDHVCVYHPRCHSSMPVCYPVSIINEAICPLKAEQQFPLRCPSSVNLNETSLWQQNGVAVAGGKGEGSGFHQLWHPQGLYIDDDQTMYIADQNNHRILEWKLNATNGRVVAGGNGGGSGDHQLFYPTDVVVDKKEKYLIICDYWNQRVVRWSLRNGTRGEILVPDVKCVGLTMDKNGSIYVADYALSEVRRYIRGESVGTMVAGGIGPGSGLDKLYSPRYVFVDQDHSVYVSEWGNNRVTKWVEGAQQAIVVAGGKGRGNNVTQLDGPHGIVVDRLGTVYVVDTGNNRIMRWPKGSTQGSVVAGGNGSGSLSNQLIGPIGLSFDSKGNLYVIDTSNHRLQRFNLT